MTYVPYKQRHGSISALHYQLGKLVEHKPGKFIRPDNGEAISTNRHYFAEIQPVTSVDMSAVERLQANAREYLDGLPPERREQLEREWSER